MFEIMSTPFMHGILTAIGGYCGLMVLIASFVIVVRKIRKS